MTAITIRLPNSVHQKIKALAARDDVSVNQFIASAASEKMASVLILDFLKAETAKGKRSSDFDHYPGMVRMYLHKRAISGCEPWRDNETDVNYKRVDAVIS
jgi:predicted HicB family RNase H-like nuclease